MARRCAEPVGAAVDGSFIVIIPTEAGIYWVNVTLTWGGEIVSQNYTLYVFTPETPEYQYIWMGLVIVIALGCFLLFLGLHQKDPIYLLLSGLIWLIGGILVFTAINTAWTILLIGLGVIILFQGGLEFAKKA